MKYVKVTRSDISGSYTMPIKNIGCVVNAEFDNIEDYDNGTSVTLTIVEMTEEEYAALNEFMGW
uniref:Uncharacterized protein n=1 Tax=viral metagenome TaxID=1070528 RepID=A0A6M3ITI7_9ZZZZ